MAKRLWNQASQQSNRQITATVEHYIATVLYVPIIQSLIQLVDREPNPASVVIGSTLSPMAPSTSTMAPMAPTHQPRPDKISRLPISRRISADVCSGGSGTQQQQQQRHDSLSLEDQCPFPTPQRSMLSFTEALLQHQQQQILTRPLVQSNWFLSIRTAVLFRCRVWTETYVSSDDRMAAINVCVSRLRSTSFLFRFTGSVESVALTFDRCLHQRIRELLLRYFRTVSTIETALNKRQR